MTYIAFKSATELEETICTAKNVFIESIRNCEFIGENFGIRCLTELLDKIYDSLSIWQKVVKHRDDSLCEELNFGLNFSLKIVLHTYLRSKSRTFFEHGNQDDMIFLKNMFITVVDQYMVEVHYKFLDKYFTCIFYGNNENDADEDDYYYCPNHIVKKQPYKLAMAMAYHPRLGINSLLRNISVDVIQLVWQNVAYEDDF